MAPLRSEHDGGGQCPVHLVHSVQLGQCGVGVGLRVQVFEEPVLCVERLRDLALSPAKSMALVSRVIEEL